MTSINLVSPNANGYEYNVRFREPIKLPANAKVYLNHASFSRDSEIYFSDTQTITLDNMDIYPIVKPHNTANLNVPITSSFEIPVINPTTKKRGYSYKDLSDLITTKFGELRDANNQFRIYDAVEYEDLLVSSREVNSIAMGFYTEGGSSRTTGIVRKDFEIDGNNSRNADISGASNGEVYIKSNATEANMHYDSYAVSDKHYHHFQGLCTGQLDKVNNNVINCTTNVDMVDQLGAISIGLYCKEFVDTSSAFSGWAEKTKGTTATTAGGSKVNPAIFIANTQQGTASAGFAGNSKNCKLGSFMTIEITPSSFGSRNKSKMKVMMPINASGQFPRDWADINQTITGMREIHTESLTSVFGADLQQPADFSFQTYINTENDNWKVPADRRIYIRVYKGDINSTPIYDSITDGHYFKQTFFTGLDATGQTQARNQAVANSQIPFNIIVASQAQNEGFLTINYPEFDKSKGSNSHPISLLGSYNLTFSQELAQVLGKVASTTLFPNKCEMDTRFFYFDDFISDWKNNNFDIYINNLPIRNFKNKEDNTDGGYAKSILASVPAPFMNSDTSHIKGNNIITGVFQPSIMNVLSLKNQEVFVNNFQVSIKRGNTDEPADALIKSNICFTITE
tara:strand:+ start:877 stop:2754 length:1878 start_codon:yes stop_codon:yes gene_type:complete